jgi:hypothetical protein
MNVKSSSQPEGLVMLADIASSAGGVRGRDASNDRVGVSVGVGEGPNLHYSHWVQRSILGRPS